MRCLSYKSGHSTHIRSLHMYVQYFYIGIPPVGNLIVADQCTNVTASWVNTEGRCRDLSYNVTLSSSDGVTLGPFTTSDTNYTFTGLDTINGTISVNIFAFNDNAMGSHVTITAVADVSPSG